MARPLKKGLDYFPLDVDMDQDDKVTLIEAQHGLIGFAIITKLLMKIYKNGYFYEWTETEQLLFSKRNNVNSDLINEIIASCIKWNLFDKNLYDKYKILTSKGIQRRYLEAMGRRKTIKIEKNYFLLHDEIVNVDNNPINAGNNFIDVDINAQRKEKESKENKSKVDEKKEGNFSPTKSKIVQYFNNNMGHMITETEIETLNSFVDDGMSEDAVVIAIEQAVLQAKRSVAYIKKILQTWIDQGVRTEEQAKLRVKEWESKKAKKCTEHETIQNAGAYKVIN